MASNGVTGYYDVIFLANVLMGESNEEEFEGKSPILNLSLYKFLSMLLAQLNRGYIS